MKTALLFFASCLLICSSLNAQQIVFSRIYYDSLTATHGFSVVPAYDNGFMIAGDTDFEGLIMKIDSAGNHVWSKKVGVSNGVSFNTIITTLDSCFVLCGSIGISTGDALIVKINMNGDTLWSKAINGSGYIETHSIQQTIDSGYILIGTVHVSAPSSTRVHISKLDNAGNLEWTNELPGLNNSNNGYNVKQTPDSGYAIIGFGNSTPGSLDASLIKLSSSGALSWWKNYNFLSPAVCFGNDLEITGDGFLCQLLADSKSILMKTDFSGNIVWTKSYLFGDPGMSLIRTLDSCYVFISGFAIVKVDSAGDVLWAQNLFLGTTDVIESKDRGFLLLGNGPLIGVRSLTISSPHIGIIKTDSLGNGIDCTTPYPIIATLDTLVSTPAVFSPIAGGVLYQASPAINVSPITSVSGCISVIGSIEENNLENNFTIHPNPTRDKITVETNVENSYLEVNDISGKLLLTHAITSSKFEIDLGKFSNGLYFLTIYEKGFQAHRKIIKN